MCEGHQNATLHMLVSMRPCQHQHHKHLQQQSLLKNIYHIIPSDSATGKHNCLLLLELHSMNESLASGVEGIHPIVIMSFVVTTVATS